MESKYKVGEVLLVNNKYWYRVERVTNERDGDELYTLQSINYKTKEELWMYESNLINHYIIKNNIGSILYGKNNSVP